MIGRWEAVREGLGGGGGRGEGHTMGVEMADDKP